LLYFLEKRRKNKKNKIQIVKYATHNAQVQKIARASRAGCILTIQGAIGPQQIFTHRPPPVSLRHCYMPSVNSTQFAMPEPSEKIQFSSK